MFSLNDIDYPLPEHLIAEKPADRRDESRLLAVSRVSGTFEDKKFSDIAGCLREGDLLVFNATKVIKARIEGTLDTGKPVELLLIEPQSDDYRRWKVLMKGSGKIKLGTTGSYGGIAAKLLDRLDKGERIVEFAEPVTHDVLEQIGLMPVPPYIVKKRLSMDMPAQLPEDDKWYQTIFARYPGSVAAPTAALHFTDAVTDALRSKGVKFAEVVLHVGPGTFRPVEGSIEDYKIHSEWVEVSKSTAAAVRETRKHGGRIVAVGTTTTRSLEAASLSGIIEPFRDYTDLFIRPPYEFKSVDALITNFHMPRSTLLLLVYAFAGSELVRGCYDHAMASGYRFYSYGDAMFIY